MKSFGISLYVEVYDGFRIRGLLRKLKPRRTAILSNVVRQRMSGFANYLRLDWPRLSVILEWTGKVKEK